MGWLEKSDIKLISTQVLAEVEVELGNIKWISKNLNDLLVASQNKEEES